MFSTYSQKAVFSFEKGLSRQNHSSLVFLHQVKMFPPIKCIIPPAPLKRNLPPPLTATWKPCLDHKKYLKLQFQLQINMEYGKLKAYKSKQYFVEM